MDLSLSLSPLSYVAQIKQNTPWDNISCFRWQQWHVDNDKRYASRENVIIPVFIEGVLSTRKTLNL